MVAKAGSTPNLLIITLSRSDGGVTLGIAGFHLRRARRSVLVKAQLKAWSRRR